ncbi:hypothetical protein LINGRAHAP2_LOCUS15122 [Linum grandiflorum]
MNRKKPSNWNLRIRRS